MPFDSLILKIFDKQKKGNDPLSVSEKLELEEKYIKVEQIWKGIRGFEDGQTIVELRKKVTLDLLKRGVFVVEYLVKFL